MLDSWAKQPFANGYVTKDSNDHHALLNSFLHEVEPFDCLIIARWHPSENQLSDVVAALFDSDWGHPFALPILNGVLDALVSKQSLTPTMRDTVSQIQRSLDISRTRISVRREHVGLTSRADIDVFRRGSEGFFVRIEHKLRGGTETFSADAHQTTRLWKDAVEEGLGFPNVLGIFLSPEGRSAQDSNFVKLSFRELAKAVNTAVTGVCTDTKLLPPAAVSILGFMSFYGRAL